MIFIFILICNLIHLKNVGQVNEVALTTIDGALTIELAKEKKRYLQFNHEDFLFPVTCSQLEGGHVIAVDPSSFEETHSLANV